MSVLINSSGLSMRNVIFSTTHVAPILIPYEPVVLADNPTGYWPYTQSAAGATMTIPDNGATGTSIVDLVSGTTPGTVVTGPTTPNPITYGVQGHGTSGRTGLTLTNSMPAWITGNIGYGNNPLKFTYECWVKTTVPRGAIFGFEVYNSTLTPNFDRELFITIDGNAVFRVYNSRVGNGEHEIISSGVNIIDGNWHHIVLTYEANVSTNLYVDGALNATTALPASQPYTTQNTYYLIITSATMNSSIPHSPGSDPWFNGSLQDLAFYNNIILTPTQVAYHYTVGSA